MQQQILAIVNDKKSQLCVTNRIETIYMTIKYILDN